ncbi:MAG: efflux transporter outer membrane subunit [Candidatus Acidiferrales bacterium]
MRLLSKSTSDATRRQAPWLVPLLAAATIQLNGCAVGPRYHTPSAEVPPAYKEAAGWKPAQPNDQNLGGSWWEMFQDPQLNALEQQVDVSNQTLKAAEAQYTQARELLRYYRADYYPTVTTEPSATRTRVSANAPPPGSALDGITYNDFELPFDVSYEADVWGQVRKTVESYREQAQASAADLGTINLSVHADLAIDYFLARSLDAEERLLTSTVAQYEQALDLVQSQFSGGIASDLEVEQASTQLETTRAEAIDVGIARAQYEHALAILIGKPPAEFTLPPLPLSAPPPEIPVGLPSELLERRPDVAAAERRVAAANAQIGVAKSAYYPLVNLGASGGFESASITTVIQGPSGLWSFGLSAVEIVFDAGRRRATSDQAIAAYDQTVANYRETVLTSFQQVEDNVAALRILESEASVQDRAVQHAQNYLNLAITRYKGGVTSYLEVTTAQTAALSDEVTAVNILGRRMVDAVSLIQALGGGWDRSALPARPECCGNLASN